MTDVIVVNNKINNFMKIKELIENSTIAAYRKKKGKKVGMNNEPDWKTVPTEDKILSQKTK